MKKNHLNPLKPFTPLTPLSDGIDSTNNNLDRRLKTTFLNMQTTRIGPFYFPNRTRVITCPTAGVVFDRFRSSPAPGLPFPILQVLPCLRNERVKKTQKYGLKSSQTSINRRGDFFIRLGALEKGLRSLFPSFTVVQRYQNHF